MASEVSAHWRQLGITLFSLKSGVLKLSFINHTMGQFEDLFAFLCLALDHLVELGLATECKADIK